MDADHISSSGSTLTMAEHNKLNESQVRRAAAALLKHVNSAKAGKSNLLEDEGEVVLAQVSLHKIPGKVTAKPIPIAIPHPLRRSEDCDMCLFVKDNAKSWIKEMVEAEPVEGLTKVSNGTLVTSWVSARSIASSACEISHRRSKTTH